MGGIDGMEDEQRGKEERRRGTDAYAVKLHIVDGVQERRVAGRYVARMQCVQERPLCGG